MAHVHLITGNDEHLLRRAAERLLRRLRTEIPDIEVIHLDTAETDGLPEMRTASLFGGTTAVVVRGAETLSGRMADDVVSYLEQPDPQSVLVLVAKGTGRIRAIARRATEIGEKHEVKAPAPWAEREWQEIVRAELRQHDRDADAGAVNALLERAGTDTGEIASRCAQVAAATPAGSRISVADVENIVDGHGNRGGFSIADAIAERDPAGAIVAVRGAIEAGESELGLLGAVTFRLRQLLQVRSGASPKEAGMSQGQHTRLQRIVRSFGPGELAWCHDRAARADLDLKSSDLPSALVFEVAVIDLATSRDVGPPWNPVR